MSQTAELLTNYFIEVGPNAAGKVGYINNQKNQGTFMFDLL